MGSDDGELVPPAKKVAVMKISVMWGKDGSLQKRFEGDFALNPAVASNSNDGGSRLY